jgi:hypothetical protein
VCVYADDSDPDCRILWVAVQDDEPSYDAGPCGCLCNLTDDQMTLAYESVITVHPGYSLPWVVWGNE